MSLTRWLRRAASSHKTRKPVSRRLLFETLEARDNPSGGLLDPTFGTGGMVSLPNSAVYQVRQTVVQADGEILAVGTSLRTKGLAQVSVTRLNADGTLDQTFGTNGTVNLPVGNDSHGYAVALEPDGKILVGAHVYVGKTNSDGEYAIGRLNQNGTLDTSFGNNKGWWLANPTSGIEEITKLTVVPNGTSFNIYGGGDAYNASPQGFAVVKLDANGHADATYGANGIAVQHLGTSQNMTLGFAVTSTGEAFEIGGGYIMALNPLGQLNTNFNGMGYVPPVYARPLYGIAVQGNEIVVTGQLVVPGVSSQGLLARYTMTGTLDTTFGNGGTYLTPSALAPTVVFNDLAIEADGSIALVGSTSYKDANNITHPSLMVGHLSADGVADTSFGTDGTGFVVCPELANYIGYLSIALDPSGNFVIGGNYTNPNSPQAVVLRFTHP
jgi:uncharacterized delta-60 repeat protein